MSDDEKTSKYFEIKFCFVLFLTVFFCSKILFYLELFFTSKILFCFVLPQ